MDDIILRISRHYFTGLAGLAGLGAATYLIRRYLSNNEKTTNAHYTRSDELENKYNLPALIHPSARKVYLLWNGSFNSTYLLLDYLQQDYIVQPLYIERYTIRKALEHDLLQARTNEYNTARANGIICKSTVLEYLADVAKIKKQQEKEISQMTILRRVIMNQYSEFRANLLPTRYITTIEKDLAHSQKFYDALRTLDLPQLEYTGVELFEQAARYVAHLEELKELGDTKVVIGWSQDSHLSRIIKHINKNMENIGKIELPLANIPNATIKYLASVKINKEVMRFLNSIG